jgi:hypothetical protein
MNLTSPVLKGAIQAAEFPGNSVASLVKMADDSPDGVMGMVMSGLAGVAAALAVAIVLTVYLRSGYRSGRDMLRHGLAATAVLALLAFVAWDMRHAALAYLGINPARPAVEFEIRLPTATLSDGRESQVELVTNRNQKLAQIEGPLASDNNGHSVLKGSVTLDYRTTDRFVILNVPGQPPRLFKLRLAANPSHSDQFGPWHLVDRVAWPSAQPVRTEPDDTFAIRYRVL